MGEDQGSVNPSGSDNWNIPFDSGLVGVVDWFDKCNRCALETVAAIAFVAREVDVAVDLPEGEAKLLEAPLSLDAAGVLVKADEHGSGGAGWGLWLRVRPPVP